MNGWNPGIFGKAAVYLRAEIDHIERRGAPEHGFDQDPFAHPPLIGAGAHRGDPAASIRALNARELKGGARPAVVLGFGNATGSAKLGRLGHGFGIPADPGVDIGVVDPRRANPDQDFTRPRQRHRHIIAQVQLVEPAVAGQQDRAHDGGNGHSARSSPNWFRYHFWKLMTLPS